MAERPVKFCDPCGRPALLHVNLELTEAPAAEGLTANPDAVDLCVQCLAREMSALLRALPPDFKRAWRDRLCSKAPLNGAGRT